MAIDIGRRQFVSVLARFLRSSKRRAVIGWGERESAAFLTTLRSSPAGAPADQAGHAAS